MKWLDEVIGTAFVGGFLIGVILTNIIYFTAFRSRRIDYHSFSYPYIDGPSDPDL